EHAVDEEADSVRVEWAAHLEGVEAVKWSAYLEQVPLATETATLDVQGGELGGGRRAAIEREPAGVVRLPGGVEREEPGDQPKVGARKDRHEHGERLQFGALLDRPEVVVDSVEADDRGATSVEERGPARLDGLPEVPSLAGRVGPDVQRAVR